MSTVVVSSASALSAALLSATSGETIELAPGTYSGVSISGVSGVTLTSEVRNNPAILTSLCVTNSTNVKFNVLEFSFPEAANATVAANCCGVVVTASNGVSFSDDSFHGVMNGDPTLDIHGLMIENSSTVSVTNSEFQLLDKAIIEENNNGVTIHANSFHDIRSDGVDNVGTSNLTISDNNFTSFDPYDVGETGGDHPDAIQFWNSGAIAPSSNIMITNNVIVQGDGEPIQGIFLRDEVGDMPYKDVSITNNLIIGGMGNAIYEDDGIQLNVTGNTVLGLTTDPDKPSIRIMNVSDAVLSGNNANNYLSSNDPGMTTSGDTTIALASDGGLSTLTSWLASHTSHVLDFGPTTAAGLVSDVTTVSLLGVQAGSVAGFP